MIQARPYRSEDKALWDSFVKASKNGTFLLERDFMEYHQDRFTDCSLTLWDDGDLVALLPANWEEATRTVWSHQGLTYGGLVMSTATTTQQAVEALAEAARYWSDTLGARTFIYKAVPYIYSTQPAQEDLYALSRLNARKKWCLASTAVDIKAPLRMRTLRQRCVKKALEADCYVERVGEGETESLREFWHILEEVLSTRHNLTPVHSVEEMQLLMARFPANIRLYDVRRGERMVAGCVVFETARVAHVQYIAAGEEGRSCGALDLLFKHLISERYKGMDYLDFGVSTEDHGRRLNEGLIFQKEGFGGRAVCYDVYEVNLAAALAQQPTERIEYLSLMRLNSRHQPELGERMARVAEDGWYLLGEWNRRFAREWAERCKRNYCVNCGNGLDALTLTLMAAKKIRGWRDGDEVIVPANTFIATLLAVVRAGLKPVPVEPSEETALMTPEGAAERCTERTVALLPVHLYGRRCRMKGFRRLADERGLFLMDDCAQAHGIDDGRKGDVILAESDANCWSFYPGKNLGALGDAGAVTTDGALLARTIEEMANYGQARKYINVHPGCNSRMDEMQAAALSLKLPALKDENERRRAIALRYIEGVVNPKVKLPCKADEVGESVWHIFPLRSAERERLQEHLKACGVETMTHYPVPPHRQEAMKGIVEGDFPVTERWADEELSLPIAPYLTDEEVERVIKAVNEAPDFKL